MKISFYFQDDGMLIPNEYKKKTENNYKKAVIHIVFWLEIIITEHIYILRQQVSPFHERAFQIYPYYLFTEDIDRNSILFPARPVLQR